MARRVRPSWLIVPAVAIAAAWLGGAWSDTALPSPEIIVRQLLMAAPEHEVSYDFGWDDLDGFADWWQRRGLGYCTATYKGWRLEIGTTGDGRIIGSSAGPGTLTAFSKEQVLVRVVPMCILSKLHEWTACPASPTAAVSPSCAGGPRLVVPYLFGGVRNGPAPSTT
jgi:hypothetical protein